MSKDIIKKRAGLRIDGSVVDQYTVRYHGILPVREAVKHIASYLRRVLTNQ